MCFGLSESADRVPSYGLAPVDHGRAPLLGAERGEDPAALATALERRYVVAWSAARTAADLEAFLGGSAAGWLRRTIDLKVLVARVAGEAEAPAAVDEEELSSAAAAFHVPSQRDGDVLDAATTTAVLFLVVATKLQALGFDDTASLIRGTTGPR